MNDSNLLGGVVSHAVVQRVTSTQTITAAAKPLISGLHDKVMRKERRILVQRFVVR